LSARGSKADVKAGCENSHYSNHVLLSTMLLNNAGVVTNNFSLLEGSRMDVDRVRGFQKTD
jgi:hypothetical protein